MTKKQSLTWGWLLGCQKGVSLIEILVGITLVTLVSIATFSYFVYGLGGIGKQGNRRAALERARERLEQVMATNASTITPTIDPSQPATNQPQYWVSCTGAVCTLASVKPSETVTVGSFGVAQPMPIEATIQWKDDPAAGTAGTPDVLEIGVKVWFTTNTGVNDNFNRVFVKTLRTP